MKGLISGSLLGAVVFFVWGFLFWAVLPLGTAAYKPVPNPDAVIAALNGSALESGTYMYPMAEDMSADGAMEKVQALHDKGPLFEIRFHKAGVSMMDPMMMISGFIHFLISTLLAAMLLRYALPQLQSFKQRVLFFTLFGLASAVFIHLSGPIWFYYPWDRALIDVLYVVLGWTLVGLVMAWRIKPQA
ncbi:MAG: hypothetical protein H7X80_01460, partial [bacterium]|nr:hypothetical protein [Candidatus Kapabacteria bacterium]